MTSSNSPRPGNFLRPDGTPDIGALIVAFTRCAPTAPGGLAWLDQMRDCRWAGMFTDGRKHNGRGENEEAKPWEGASDCRPFVVDDIIQEAVDVDVVSFWRAMVQPASAQGEEDGYAVALAEHLIFEKMFDKLLEEVELSSQYRHGYGWCVLAPRWKREISLRRYTLTLQDVAGMAGQATKQLQKISAEFGVRSAELTPGAQIPLNNPSASSDRLAQLQSQLPGLQAAAVLPGAIMDPAREDEAIKGLQDWYEQYIQGKLPADLLERSPKLSDKRVRKCVQDLRKDGRCQVPLPYLCKNEPEIFALKPYEEVAIPNERTDAKELMFQIEWVTEAELRGRALTKNYKPAWVEEAIKHKGSWSPQQLQVSAMPIGLNGLLAQGTAAPLADTGQPMGMDSQYVRIIHAMYREADEDGIPGVYLTTFHTEVKPGADGQDLFAEHGLMDTAEDELPNVTLLRERRARSVTLSRSVTELTYTDQFQIKGIRDGMIDRQSITLLPPVNVYENPTGVKYKFGPAKQNYVKPGKEPAFMQMPSGQGVADATETHNMLQSNLDRRFGRMNPEVSPTLVSVRQENKTRRFLATWTQAIKLMLRLWQKFGSDAEFSEVTGAPAGWLEARRNDEDLLSTAMDFDPRELDPKIMLERIETMNKIVLPNDVLGVIQRGKWAGIMARAVVGARTAKQLVQPLPDASQALQEKAQQVVLQMFAGNTPKFVDKDDPTAASLLQFTQQIVMSNPNYLRALTDDALAAVAGQQAPMIVQSIGQRKPDARFSELLLKWLKNLQFIGVTQQQNKQIGAIGVNPNQEGK